MLKKVRSSRYHRGETGGDGRSPKFGYGNPWHMSLRQGFFCWFTCHLGEVRPSRTVGENMRTAKLGLLFVSAVLVVSPQAEAGPIIWTSTSFTANTSARVGRSSAFSAPSGFTSTEALDTDTANSSTLPLPGPTDTDFVQSSVVLDNGLPNWRQATGVGDATGTLATTTLNAGGGAVSRNTSILNQTIKSEGIGTTIFMGEFISTGNPLDLAFDGTYNLFAFSQNNLLSSIQRGEGQVTATLLVQNLTSLSTVSSTTIFNQSAVRASFGVTNIFEQPFSGGLSVDLSDTAGDAMKVTITTIGRGTSYAHRTSFESSSFGPAGAQGAGTFNEFNATFTTEPFVNPIPEPSSLVLLTLGCVGAWAFRRSKHSRNN